MKNKSDLLKTNTLIIIVLGVIVAAIAGLLFVSSSQKPDNQSESGQVTQFAPNYAEYSPATLAKAKESGRTLLFFWAPWCGTCAFLDDELKKRSSELPSDLTILRANYDTERELKNKYSVVFQHTLVQVDKDGNEIKKWIGGGVDLLKKQLK